jgi:hypothetical protein
MYYINVMMYVNKWSINILMYYFNAIYKFNL